MDYITAEQFKKQSQKVQEVLNEYHAKYYQAPLRGIPLYNETVLRHFIEEKTKGPVEIHILSGQYFLTAMIPKNGSHVATETYCYNDLLQAYWEIACKIAVEIVSIK